jgi:hypothetical protein
MKRSRALHTPNFTQQEVKQAIDDLLAGSKPASLPTRLCRSVITTLTQMRKDALLHRQDGQAAKMEVILGELQRGPQRYRDDTPADPHTVRARALTVAPNATLHETSKLLSRGARPDSVDSPMRQDSVPVMKTQRARQVSRTNYGKARGLDQALDACAEYEADSRLLRVRQLEERSMRRDRSMKIVDNVAERGGCGSRRSARTGEIRWGTV